MWLIQTQLFLFWQKITCVGENRQEECFWEEMSSLYWLPSTKPELFAFLSCALILSSQLKWNFVVPLWFFLAAFHCILLVCLWAHGLFDSFAIVYLLTSGFLCLKLFLPFFMPYHWQGLTGDERNKKALQTQGEVASPKSWFGYVLLVVTYISLSVADAEFAADAFGVTGRSSLSWRLPFSAIRDLWGTLLYNLLNGQKWFRNLWW